ncbi:tetratricopeptide repeat protein [Rosistilla carotiformis]|uniref:Tetratricopeptide repeat protein n=1 Tax=Rosistilla carotiformis TaxID=2528017 RepID=A0A518JML3_9BACT|nr:tetratricopeptide repeat protein [Rosistilla carotiformis]QDV66800.1 tetratricopeptide repeat protein [Rosistilla carotiformis]
MKRLKKLLVVVLLLEIVLCGLYVKRRLWRHHVVLPTVTLDDPLLATEFQELADQAAAGGSEEWQALGEGLLGQGFYGEAEHAFRAAVDIDPGNYMAQFALAFCLDRTGRIAESSEAYLKASEIERKSKQLIGSVEHCLYQVGKNELRAEDAGAAIDRFASQAGFAPASYQYAKLLVRDGKVDRALPVLEMQLGKTPLSLKFNALRLQALEATGQQALAAQAADVLQRSRYMIPIDMSTNFVTPLNQRLGIARKLQEYNELLATGDMDLLAKHLQTMWDLAEPTTLHQKSAILISMAEVAFQRRRAEEILQAVDRLKAIGVSSPDMLQMEGAAYQMNGDIDRAIGLWLRASKMSPNIPLHQILADAYQEKNDDARRDFHLGQAGLLEAKQAFWNNQWEPAKQAAQRAIDADPSLDQAWFYLAEIERALGNAQPALEAYQKCLDLNPNRGRALAAAARLRDAAAAAP